MDIKKREMNILVSVIVAVYNIAPFLKQCLNSLVSQTYSNYEVIMVDDGSSDGSGEICDEYAEKYEKFKVVHQSNSGLGAARNSGICRANGEIIMFVDGDDWVSVDFIRIAADAMCRTSADIVCFGMWDVGNGDREPEVSFSYSQETIVDGKEALKMNIYSNLGNGGGCVISNSAVNKAYRKCFFDNIKFPEAGRRYEDLAVMYRLLFSAERVCCIPEVSYCYRNNREGSIMNTKSLQNKGDELLAHMERYSFLKKEAPELAEKELSGIIIFYIMAALEEIVRIKKADKYNSALLNTALSVKDIILAFLKKYINDIMSDANIGIKHKTFFKFFLFKPELAMNLLGLYR